MYRFTDRARQVMRLANQEAQRFNHEYIGTEHILLGLIKEGSCVAANVLKNLDVDPHKIRLDVEKLMQGGSDPVTMNKLPQTPRARAVLDYAREEARNLNHNYVDTGDLLLGLLREGEGIAAQVLMDSSLTVEMLRAGAANLDMTGLLENPTKAAESAPDAAEEQQPRCQIHFSVTGLFDPADLPKLRRFLDYAYDQCEEGLATNAEHKGTLKIG